MAGQTAEPLGTPIYPHQYIQGEHRLRGVARGPRDANRVVGQETPPYAILNGNGQGNGLPCARIC